MASGVPSASRLEALFIHPEEPRGRPSPAATPHNLQLADRLIRTPAEHVSGRPDAVQQLKSGNNTIKLREAFVRPEGYRFQLVFGVVAPKIWHPAVFPDFSGQLAVELAMSIREKYENSGQREQIPISLRFPFPGWEEKAIDDSGFPNIFIARGGELSRVAG